MITKENKIEKICSFYASDYHLEMIILPYINKKIDEKAKIVISTKKDLSKTMEKVVSQINLPEERKRQIIDINWNKNDNVKVDEIIKNSKGKEIIMFVIGDKNYIENTNKTINSNEKSCNMKIVNCYNFQEIRNDIQDIASTHSKILNSSNVEKIN